MVYIGTSAMITRDVAGLRRSFFRVMFHHDWAALHLSTISS